MARLAAGEQAALDAILRAEVIEDEGAAAALMDRAAELQKRWQVKRGDIWEVGRHRVMCGDSTSKEDVGRLMRGDKANLVFTDPPYGVDYVGGRNPKSNAPRQRLIGDISCDLYEPCMDMCCLFAHKTAPCYIWFAASIGKPIYQAIDKFGFTIRAMIVWNKIDAHYGNFMAQYMQKHEPCLYCVRDAPKWIGATNEVTVWDVKQPSVSEFHPTQKPVDLALRAIGNHDAPIVADWFLGSGTTLVAAEKLGRIGRGMEISEAYTAVSLQRLSDLGLTPKLIERAAARRVRGDGNTNGTKGRERRESKAQ